jgi:hypothetical protein
MKFSISFLVSCFSTLILFSPIAPLPGNQTPTVSKVHSDKTLPFRIKIKKIDFELPTGLQSYIHGIYKDKWLLLTGRIGGLHGFVLNSPDNFPANEQNTTLFVVDPKKKKVYTRSLLDPQSGLTQEQVDYLSVTAAQAYQLGNTLYITGGYGINTATGRPDTKNILTAIDVPGLIHWVKHPSSGETAAQHIRQISNDIFKVTGGYMNQIGNNPTLLVMGHEFDGFYDDPSQDPPVFQQYTEQVRRFVIHDDGVNLSITPKSSLPKVPDPNYRRRDLNVVPVVKSEWGRWGRVYESFEAFSGVFTPAPDTGVWTVPVEVSANGHPSMADPNLSSTFKQGMNNYDCATFGMYSETTNDMYTILFGGISFGYFAETPDGLKFETDPEIPFINQTTTVRKDRMGRYTQYLMHHGAFPVIPSQTVNPGNLLLFGSECELFFLDCIERYSNDVVKLDLITKPTVIGYIVGGIQSTVPNTNSQADSSPSTFIFEVILKPVHNHVCPFSLIEANNENN